MRYHVTTGVVGVQEPSRTVPPMIPHLLTTSSPGREAYAPGWLLSTMNTFVPEHDWDLVLRRQGDESLNDYVGVVDLDGAHLDAMVKLLRGAVRGSERTGLGGVQNRRVSELSTRVTRSGRRLSAEAPTQLGFPLSTSDIKDWGLL